MTAFGRGSAETDHDAYVAAARKRVRGNSFVLVEQLELLDLASDREQHSSRYSLDSASEDLQKTGLVVPQGVFDAP